MTIRLFICAYLALFVYACSPDTPENNVEDKGHEEAYKTVFSFTPGLLADTIVTVEESELVNVIGKGFTPEVNAQPVEVIFNTLSDGSVATADSAHLEANRWYKLEVQFWNRAGEDIVPQFVDTQEQQDAHLFFFKSFQWEPDANSVQDMYKNLLVGDKNPLRYLYGDTDASGNIIFPPIGFVGYVYIDKEVADRELADGRFFLNVKLYHLQGVRDKLVGRNKLRPFDDDRGIFGQTDLDRRFPIIIK